MMLRSKTEALSEPFDLVDAKEPRFVWSRDGYGTAAWGSALSFDPGVGPERFERAWGWFHDQVAGARVVDQVDTPGSGPIAYVSFTFDPQRPGSRVVIPQVVAGRNETGSWLTHIWRDERSTVDVDDLFGADLTGGQGEIKTSYDQPGESFIEAVTAARAAIGARGLQKVVLARTISMSCEGTFNLARIISHLCAEYPGCFTFLNDSFVGATPELLVRRLGDWVDSIPLAGSSRRGTNPAEDDALGKALLASTKDRWEHSLTVDSVVQKLRPLCTEVSVEEEPFLYLLPNVQHLGTKIQGRLAHPCSALEAAGLLHPTAAVCGVPEDSALEMIRRLEPHDRRSYGGPVGWVDHRGDGEIAIALRCAQVETDTATVYAGAGIVADSDPYAELAETELKARAMLAALSR